ncbi:MAG: 16S rRNA (guanine(966)-N(2))-methyltransferase RsmD [Lachnospiraceae bacterium]|nr:16S rRNA (guanine(966)-N(2))-methyltransferase RsmD [Lachnospiraceae bacterium]
MRVIAGEKRHLLLKCLPGDKVRPTTDITKETLFNILNPYIPGCSFLDLFSGTGAIGIEAMSRGAEKVVFVDNARDSLSCIKDNLKHTGLIDDARIIANDAVSAVVILEGEGKAFDVIFMDPPYDNELEKRVLERLSGSVLVNDDTVIVVEASKKTDMSYLPDLGFYVFKEKDYKNNKHVFIRKREV